MILVNAIICIELLALSAFPLIRKKGKNVYIVLFFLLCALTVNYLAERTVTDFIPRPTETITVTALDTKDSASGSTSVYITDISVDGERYPYHVLNESDWYPQNSLYMWKPDHRSEADLRTIELEIPLGSERTISLMSNASKGSAEITCNGQTQTIDCYAPEEHTIVVDLPAGSSGTLQRVFLLQAAVYAIVATLLNLLLYRLLPGAPETPPNRKRNGAVEFFRFVMSVIVIIHHFKGYGPSRAAFAGYLCVDVFFVISGFFLMQHFSTHTHPDAPGTEALRYLGGRLRAIFPHHVFSWFCMLFIVLYFNYITVAKLPETVFEFFLLRGISLSHKASVSGVTWYLSVLLFLSYFIYYLLCKNKNLYLYFLAPLAYALIMSYLYQEYGNLNVWVHPVTILTEGTFRGLAEVSIGCIAYSICQFLRTKNLDTPGIQLLATLLEIAAWSVIIYQMWCGKGYLDFIVPVLAGVVIISHFTVRSHLTRLLDNDLSAYLGKLSFPMYLNQFIIIRPVQHLLPGYPFVGTTTLLLLTLILFSMLSDRIVSGITKRVLPARR